MESASNTKAIYKDKKRRAWELDFLRGVAVIAMCFDHLMWDLAHPNNFFGNFYEVENSAGDAVFSFAKAYMSSTGDFGFRFWAHYLFVFLFLFLVGISCAFSRDNTRRGALCGVAALAFTGISFLCKMWGFMTYGVVFGILECIALSILCCAALDNITALFGKHVNKYAPLVLGGSILLAGILVGFWNNTYDSEFVWGNFTRYVLGWDTGFGDDWFGLFPYVGAVLLGMYCGKAQYFTRQTVLPALDRAWHKPFTFVGRHALWFYFFHQPVLAGAVMLIGMCMGYTV